MQQMTTQNTIDELESQLIKEKILNVKIGLAQCLIGLYGIRKIEKNIEKYERRKADEQTQINETT